MGKYPLLTLLVAGLGCAGAPGEQDGTELTTHPIVVPDTSLANSLSAHGPNGAHFNFSRYFTYLGRDLALNVVKQVSDSEYVKRTLPQTSEHGAAILAYNGQLFMTWVGLDGNRSLNIMRSSDGLNWDFRTKQILNKTGLHHRGLPSMVEFNGSLLIFAEGTASGRPPRYIVTYNVGTDNVAKGPFLLELPETSLPSASVLNNRIFLHWLCDGGASLCVKKAPPGEFPDSQTWTVTEKRPIAAWPHIFSAISNPPKLYMVLTGRGNIGANQIEFFQSFDGVNFDWVDRSVHTSGARPFGIRGTDHTLEFVHAGMDSNKSLNWNVHFFR